MMPKSGRVSNTNDSSTTSKLSVVNHGYMTGDDPFLSWFVPKAERRTSLINRGYYVRMWTVQHLLERLIQHSSDDEPLQFVGLGAGFDSLFLRMINDVKYSRRIANWRFVEVDLPNVIERKIAVLREKYDCVPDSCPKSQPVTPILTNYHLIACDLRRTHSLLQLLLEDAALRRESPTVFVAECVLNYLTAEEADAALRMVSNNFTRASVIVYEQIYPKDSFGRKMLEHFNQIGSPLLSIHRYPDERQEMDRFHKLGYSKVNCWNMNEVYYTILPHEERLRIAHLELFDEYETWHEKCFHYAIITASTSPELFDRILPTVTIPVSHSITENRTQLSDERCTSRHLKKAPSSRRFAHRIGLLTQESVDNETNMIMVAVGGWGVDESNRQRRLDNIFSMNTNASDRTGASVADITIKSETTSIVDRCYATLTPVGNDRALFMFGGRRSPTSPLVSPCLITLEKATILISELAVAETCINQPEPRWRHSATSISSGTCNSFCVFICGGLTYASNNRLKVCGDTWLFTRDVDTTWQRLPDLPIPVHSHWVCYDPDSNEAVVGGGIIALGDDTLSAHFQIYSFDTQSWKVVEMPYMLRRYGATATFIEPKILAIVGGASTATGECHSVVVARLSRCESYIEEAVEVLLPHEDDFMLMNHDAVFCARNRKLLVFGGGGNCFSFGTYFNDTVLEIDAESLINYIKNK